MEKADFKIIKTRRDFVLLYKWSDGHAHFREKQGAEKLIELLESGVMPEKKYFKTAAERILPLELFEGLRRKKKKDKYINRR